jgi:hypothetical protein
LNHQREPEARDLASLNWRVICNETHAGALLVPSFETLQVDAEFIDDLLAEIQPTAILIIHRSARQEGSGKAFSAIRARHIEAQTIADRRALSHITGEGCAFKAGAFSEWWQRIARTYSVRANFAGRQRMESTERLSIFKFSSLTKTGRHPATTGRTT